MALDSAKNFAAFNVSTGYDAAATSVALASGGGARMPTAPFNATWWNVTDYPDPSDDPNREIVRVTNIATDTLTVTRAQESTSASTKNTGSKTYRIAAGPTARLVTEIAGELSGKAASSHTHAQSEVTNLTADLAAKPSLAQVLARTLGA
jgi:hypothetical protein